MKAPRTSLRLRVVPGSSRPGVAGRLGDAWKVRVSAPAEAGRANEAVRVLLAQVLGLRRADIEIGSGAASRDKIVLLHGIGGELADRRLTAAAESSR